MQNMEKFRRQRASVSGILLILTRLRAGIKIWGKVAATWSKIGGPFCSICLPSPDQSQIWPMNGGLVGDMFGKCIYLCGGLDGLFLLQVSLVLDYMQRILSIMYYLPQWGDIYGYEDYIVTGLALLGGFLWQFGFTAIASLDVSQDRLWIINLIAFTAPFVLTGWLMNWYFSRFAPSHDLVSPGILSATFLKIALTFFTRHRQESRHRNNLRVAAADFPWR
jgi:hypothetical protein